ncbi:hypothetical protein G2W53_039866 [Senna tora]|uniref:Uncharacterized protein n=1 Tax=Senna tora TaxID=362788 RepID=A0A834SRR5_9FABA|nr:hypothetical protein G2W53_039866 [Senna tora]
MAIGTRIKFSLLIYSVFFKTKEEVVFVADTDEISSPISARILELCDSDLFPDTTTLQNSEVTSSSNCCYEENASSYATLDVENKLNRNTNTNTATTTTNNNIFESAEEIINENDISASIDFSSSSQAFSVPSSLQFDFSLVQHHHHHHPPQVTADSLVNMNVNGLSHYHVPLNHSLPSLFEEDCLGGSVGSYVPLNHPSSSNCTYLGPGIGAYMPPPPPSATPNAFSAGSSGIYGRTILMGSELQPHQDMEFQGENGGIYCPDSIHRVFNPPDLQVWATAKEYFAACKFEKGASVQSSWRLNPFRILPALRSSPLSTESQQLVNGPGSSTTMTPEISNLEDSTFKVGKLSVEQRKEKIDRYMKKRNERNFNKKIKVVVKEEDDMVDSSDIFAYISGVNSFKCNQSIQSWI